MNEIPNPTSGRLYTSDADTAAILALNPDLHIDLHGLTNVPPQLERTYIRRVINDGAIATVDVDALWLLAVVARATLRAGGVVVINCGAGINRSNFLAGLTLIGLLPPFGGRAVVAAIRQASPGALSNPDFAAYLESK